MKKIFLALATLTVLSISCVQPNVAVQYAQRAHPECKEFKNVNHSYNSDGGPSLTEVAMTCGDVHKSISVKCKFGWGLISDTTCHENN